MSDPTQNTPWRAEQYLDRTIQWRVVGANGGVLFEGMSESLARTVAAGSVAKELFEGLETAIRWLRRLEREYPGCLNDDAIDKHLQRRLALAAPLLEPTKETP